MLNNEFLLRRRDQNSSPRSQVVPFNGILCEVLDDDWRGVDPDWPQRFENADTVIFVVALPSYCKPSTPRSSQVMINLAR